MNKQEFANAIHGVTEAVKDRKDYGRIASLERQHQVAHELAGYEEFGNPEEVFGMPDGKSTPHLFELWMSQGGHCGQ